MRNLEHLSAVQFAKVIDTLDGDRHGQEIAAAWIAKESSATRWAGNSPAFLVFRGLARSGRSRTGKPGVGSSARMW